MPLLALRSLWEAEGPPPISGTIAGTATHATGAALGELVFLGPVAGQAAHAVGAAVGELVFAAGIAGTATHAEAAAEGSVESSAPPGEPGTPLGGSSSFHYPVRRPPRDIFRVRSLLDEPRQSEPEPGPEPESETASASVPAAVPSKRRRPTPTPRSTRGPLPGLAHAGRDGQAVESTLPQPAFDEIEARTVGDEEDLLCIAALLE